jgi:peroxin-19
MSPEETNAMIQAKLTETLSQMKVNSQASSEDNLSCNGLPGADSFDNLLPMMEGMMQSLLSKELLYTPMKDIAEKFPDWLADNRNKVSEEEFIKYNKQFGLTKKICFLYEEEKDSDSTEMKKKRFDKVMALMQEMQNLGHPPKELVGESPSPTDPGAFPPGMDLNGCPLQ